MAANKTSEKNSQQTIEELRQRFTKLDKKKTEAETELRGAEKALQELQQDARDKYGTDDVAELRKMLDDLKQQNETKRANYQADLDRIESDLSVVEEKFAAPSSSRVLEVGK